MTHEVVVLGAGPAGMSAAITAAELGLKTLLLDEQPRPGGQIYRNVGLASSTMAHVLGKDYLRGGRLVEKLQASQVEQRYGTLVWDVSRELEVTASQERRAFQVRAPQLIAATGAMERPSPLPGWTLPGVMNAGAAQIALKSGGYIPKGRIVLLGTGPLLLLVANQLLQAGANIAALLDTSPAGSWRHALKHLPSALRAPEYFVKGLTLLARLRAAGVARFSHVSDVEILGAEQVEGLRFVAAGKARTLDVDTVLLHHGVIPNHQLSRLLRVEHAWNAAELAWRVVCDDYGQTSLPGFRVAGDGVAIAGAIAAAASGALAALGAAHALGRIDDTQLHRRASVHRRTLQRHRAVRGFLDTLYRPPSFMTCPPDDVVVCRCEEVTAGHIRHMASIGCIGPNQTKFFSRCGMGPCQGRVCGTVVTQLLAQCNDSTPTSVGAYRVRAPLKPVTVTEVAGLETPAD